VVGMLMLRNFLNSVFPTQPEGETEEIFKRKIFHGLVYLGTFFVFLKIIMGN
jgi:uncharacterized BrkB/YihY/UPF0761 family membrane protein